MLIGSPYVNYGIIDLTNQVPEDIPRTLVTRTDLRDFALGASSLDSLCILAGNGITIKSLSNLHAKMYIFDRAALVTSANATVSGLHRNLECGLATMDEIVVGQLASSLLKGFGAKRYPPEVTLEALKASVEAIKVTLPDPYFAAATHDYSEDNSPAIEARFSIDNEIALLEGFKGWTRLTLEGVLEMPGSKFQMPELLAVCGPVAARAYPRNQNVRPKLRQQLQMLRDLGLVEFLGHGFYRRTIE